MNKGEQIVTLQEVPMDLSPEQIAQINERAQQAARFALANYVLDRKAPKLSRYREQAHNQRKKG